MSADGHNNAAGCAMQVVLSLPNLQTFSILSVDQGSCWLHSLDVTEFCIALSVLFFYYEKTSVTSNFFKISFDDIIYVQLHSFNLIWESL